MNTSINQKRSQKTSVKRELKLLKSFVIGLAGKDKEGNYKSSFAQRILKLSAEKPTKSFRNTQQFLKDIS